MYRRKGPKELEKVIEVGLELKALEEARKKDLEEEKKILAKVIDDVS